MCVFKSADTSKINLKVFKALAKAICERSGLILRIYVEYKQKKGKGIVHHTGCLIEICLLENIGTY